MKILLPALWAAAALAQSTAPPASVFAGNVRPIQEGYVDANGVLIYYVEFGHGSPLVVLHGGPGASHDYLLPWLLPLAHSNQLLFIDERGSGRSERVQCDPALARQMQERIEGSKLVILPNSGHMAFEDQPELWIDQVRDFINQ